MSRYKQTFVTLICTLLAPHDTTLRENFSLYFLYRKNDVRIMASYSIPSSIKSFSLINFHTPDTISAALCSLRGTDMTINNMIPYLHAPRLRLITSG